MRLLPLLLLLAGVATGCSHTRYWTTARTDQASSDCMDTCIAHDHGVGECAKQCPGAVVVASCTPDAALTCGRHTELTRAGKIFMATTFIILGVVIGYGIATYEPKSDPIDLSGG